MITATMILSIIGWAQTGNGLFLASSILSGVYLGINFLWGICQIIEKLNN
jgi:hypothetical protein